ncbi:MAG: hypothetical protein LBC74_15415 [Planctomycetaceae bacterium]|nr:hypothetical protein [Planctomycetaceae bacterium]
MELLNLRYGDYVVCCRSNNDPSNHTPTTTSLSLRALHKDKTVQEKNGRKI